MTSRPTQAITKPHKRPPRWAGQILSRLMTMRMVLAIAFTMIAIVPSMFLSGWVERAVLEHEVEAVEEKHLLLATNAKQSLARYVDDVETGFDLFVQALQFNQTSHYLQQVALRLKFRSVEIYAPDGQPEFVWTVAGSDRAEIADDVRRELLADAPSDRIRFYPVRLDTRGRPTIYLTKTLKNGDVAIGVLSNAFIKKIQHSIAFGDRGHAAIVDSNGHVLAHPMTEWTNTAKDLSAIAPVVKMMRGETGVSQFFSPAVKEDMIAGYTALPSTGWGIMVPQPFAELQARVDRITSAAYMIIALGVATAAILGWFLAGLMIRPVNAVIRGTTQIADGQLGWRVPTDAKAVPRELRALGQNFNDMADEIQASHAAQKKRAEEDRRELLGRIAEHLPGIIFRRVSEPGGAVSYPIFNVGTARVFGLERHAVTTNPGAFIDAIVPEDRELWQRLVDGEIDTSESRYQDIRVTTPEGQIAWARLFGTVRRQGERIVWDGGAIDVTQEKTAEQQLNQNQKMQAMGKLTGGIAHDFNNLLAIILGHLELVEEQLAPESPLRPMTRNAIDAAEKGADLTSRLLAFTRNQELRPQATDLDLLLTDMRSMLDRSIGEKVEIDYAPNNGANIIKVDQNQLENALLNLVINARDAMPNGGRIEIETACVEIGGPRCQRKLELPAGRYIQLSVRDTGSGIAPENLDRVFEPFFTTKPLHEGSGLGLSTVHGFIRQSDGDIEIISEPGWGTTVAIYLPLASNLTLETPVVPATPVTEKGEGKSILLIEDETVVGDICENFLDQLGYRVTRADTGEKALQILHDQAFRFDGIVSDVVLPGTLTGPNVVEFALQHNPAIGVLMMSGYPEDHCKKLLANCRHAIYLRKPFRKQTFGEHLTMALNATRFQQRPATATNVTTLHTRQAAEA